MIVGTMLASRAFTVVADDQTDPGKFLLKITELLDGLKGKIEKENEREAAANSQHLTWCVETKDTANLELESAKEDDATAQSIITDKEAEIKEIEQSVTDDAGQISSKTAELTALTATRDKEKSDFASNEKVTQDAIETIDKAVTKIMVELNKRPTSLAQIDTSILKKLVKTFSTIMDATSLPIANVQKLAALIQSADEGNLVYKSRSQQTPGVYTSQEIVDELETLKEKAEAQLHQLRETEKKAAAAYAVTKESMEGEIELLKASKTAEAKTKQESLEELEDARSDALKAQETIARTKKLLEETEKECSKWDAKYAEFEKVQKEELQAIAAAKKEIATAMGAVGDEAQEAPSLLQIHDPWYDAETKVLSIFRKVGHSHHSPALAQLASRMRTVMKFHTGDPDVFGNIKDQIRHLIKQLERQISDATIEEKYCSHELSRTESKLKEVEAAIKKLDTQIETSSSREVELRNKLEKTQADIAAATKQHSDLTKFFNEEEESYTSTKKELTESLAAVDVAISHLEKFYGKAADDSTGKTRETSGRGIISMLRMVENDLAESISLEDDQYRDAKETVEEKDEELTKSVAVDQVDEKHFEGQIKSAEHTTSMHKSDRSSLEAQEKTAKEELAQAKKLCIVLPMTYEERKKARMAEIKGLQEAWEILNDAISAQQSSR